MQETTSLVQTCKCIYERKYSHVNIFFFLFSCFKNLSELWNRNKSVTITSETCVKRWGCVTGAHQWSQANTMWVSSPRKLSPPCVWLLLSRLRRVSCYPHFQVWLIFSGGGTKYMGRFFTEFCAKTLRFSKSCILCLTLL